MILPRYSHPPPMLQQNPDAPATALPCIVLPDFARSWSDDGVGIKTYSYNSSPFTSHHSYLFRNVCCNFCKPAAETPFVIIPGCYGKQALLSCGKLHVHERGMGIPYYPC